MDEESLSSVSGGSNHALNSVITIDEMLCDGLKLAGFSEEKQKKQPKSNVRDFIDRYGSNPTVLCCIWEDLQLSQNELARVPEEKLNINHYLMAHHFLKQYPTESERKSMYQQRTHTLRDNVWYYVKKIAALMPEKIFIPENHILGDDIWIMTVDGTMSAANEKAGEDVTKDPKHYSHKHHSAGFNTEVGISIKESRCIWINGPGPAGENTDLVLFRKPGGLRDKLCEIGKKGIADGGYTGSPNELSTPNGHDHPSVRKFKSRALKRHEKFNNMLKNFKCLAIKFRHTAHSDTRYVTCFHAVATICQYQLENGTPLWNIYVGEM